jgi:hypothetical protein
MNKGGIMNAMIRRTIAALAIAMLFALTTQLTPASAQVGCAAVTITNNSGSPLDLTFTNGLVVYTIHNIAPGTAGYAAPGFNPTGYISAHGNFVTSAAACTGCITVRISGSLSFICAQVCAPTICSIVITPLALCAATCP